MGRCSRIGVMAALCVFLGHAAAFAQNGEIAGVVKDSSGAVLPGVTVEASSPALIEKVRSVVTDSQGQYRIIDLRPGSYVVTFTLPGFSVVKRDGIELAGAFVATVNADMRVGAVAETITVSGQSPLIDTQSVTQVKSLPADVIDALPTGRSFQNLSVLVPGVTIGLTNQDVGGSGGQRYQTLSVHGSRSDQMPLVLNGMPYNNMNNTGGGYNTTLVVNTATVQEMTVTTSALSAESRSSGVLTNTIPKEGGNTFRGYLFGNFSNGALQSDNLSPDLIDRGLTRVNSVKRLWDFNPAMGGPIVQDKLWFYGGFRHSGAQNYIAGMYKNLRPTDPQYCAKEAGCLYGDTYHPLTLVPNSQDLSHPAVGGDTWTRGETLNLTWQASQRNKITDVRPLQPAARRLQSVQRHRLSRSGGVLHASAGVSAAGDVEQSAHEPPPARGRLDVLQRALDLRVRTRQRQRLWTRCGDFEVRYRHRIFLRLCEQFRSVYHRGQSPVQHARRGQLCHGQPRLQDRHAGHVGHAQLPVRRESGTGLVRSGTEFRRR